MTTSARAPGSIVERAYRESAPLTVLCIMGIALSVLNGAAIVLQAVRGGILLPGWQLPLYWLDYRHGLVRRGLPGELVGLLSGGTPSLDLVGLLGLLLSALAVLAIALLSVRAASLAPTSLRSLLVLTVLLMSPLTVSLILRDLIRYDDIGIVLLAAAAITWRGWWSRPWLAASGVSVALVVATASTEFLLLLLGPVALLLLLRPSSRLHAGRVALAFGPALVVLLLSFLLRPSAAAAADTLRRFRAAGGTLYPEDAVTVLDDSLSQQVGAVFDLRPVFLVGSIVVMAAFYLCTTALVAWLLGLRPSGRLVGLAGYYLVLALLLGFLGIDYRRWWALAFLGLLACLVAVHEDTGAHRAGSTTGPRSPGRSLPRSAVPVAVVLLGLFLVGQRLPVFPRWDPSFSSDSSTSVPAAGGP